MSKKLNKNVPVLRFHEFVEEWEQFDLKDIALKITDGTHDTPQPISNGFPYLTAIHIRDGHIDFENCYYLPEEEHRKIYTRCNPEYGDILMVNIGAGTATVARIEVDFEFSLKNVALIKIDQDKLSSHFIFQILSKNSTRLRHQLTSGGAQPFFSLKQIGKLKIIIPKIAEQEKIARFLGAVDTRLNQLRRKRELLQTYKRGVMQKLFSQKIRFTQSDGSPFPDWEKKKLGDIFRISAGGDIEISKVNKEKNEIYKYPIYANSEKDKGLYGYTDEYKFSGGVITVTGRGNLGVAHARDHKFYPIVRLLILSPRITLNIIFFENQINQINIYTESTGVPQLTAPQFSSYKIFLPSIKEQEKIANFLTAIDCKIEALSRQIDQTEQFKKGLLQKMFV